MINKHLLATTVFLLIAKTVFCQLQPAVITGSAEMHQDLADMHYENYLENVSSKWGEATHDNELGTRAMSAGKYDEALSDFNKAISVEITYPDPYYNRGLVEYRMHNLEAAIEDFEEVNSVQSTVDPRALDMLAKATFEYGDYKGSVKALDKLIKFSPRDSKLLLRKGIAQNKLKDYKDAEKTLSKSIELDSTFSSAVYLNKGIAEMHLKKNVEALKDLTEARQMGNRRADSLINVISPRR